MLPLQASNVRFESFFITCKIRVDATFLFKFYLFEMNLFRIELVKQKCVFYEINMNLNHGKQMNQYIDWMRTRSNYSHSRNF